MLDVEKGPWLLAGDCRYQAALDIADSGYAVDLVEGAQYRRRMANWKTFPTLVVPPVS